MSLPEGGPKLRRAGAARAPRQSVVGQTFVLPADDIVTGQNALAVGFDAGGAELDHIVAFHDAIPFMQLRECSDTKIRAGPAYPESIVRI